MSFNDGFSIKGIPVPPTAPVSGNALVYDGTNWVAGAASGGGGGSSDWTRTGTILNPTVSGDSVLVNIPVGTAGVTVEETGVGASTVISPTNISVNDNLKQIDLNASVSTVKLRGDTGEGVSPVIRSVDFDDSLYTLDLQIRELSINNTVGASGEVLTSNGTGLAPTWQAISSGTASFATLAATASYVATGSAIATFTNDVRSQFSAGTNITINNGVISSSAGTASSTVYAREWHVSTGSGNDITGNGTLLSPYRTLGAGIAAASTQGGDQIVLHPGTYIENVTMGKFNTTICAAQGSNGGEVNLSGTMTVSQSIAPNSSIRLFGIAVSNLIHNGTGSLYLENCKVNNTFTKATTAYFQATSCDFNKDLLIVSGGITSFQGGNQSASGSSFLINNAGATVLVRDSITTCSPVVISGILGINDCAVTATSSGGPAITAGASSIVILVDSTTVDTSGSPTKVSIGGLFSYSNSVFNKTASTLGTLLSSTADFDIVRANTITGSTAQFTTITGSTVTGSTARFTTITGSNVSSSVVLLSSPITLTNQATTKAYVDSSIVTSAGFKKYGYFEIASGSYNTTSSTYTTQDSLSGTYVPSAATGTMIFNYDTSFVIVTSGDTVSTRLLVDGVVKRGASFLSTRASHSASLSFSYPVAITSASHTYEIQWKIVAAGGTPNATMVVNGAHDQFGSLTILEYTA